MYACICFLVSPLTLAFLLSAEKGRNITTHKRVCMVSQESCQNLFFYSPDPRLKINDLKCHVKFRTQLIGLFGRRATFFLT